MISNRERLRNAINNHDVVLRGVSALEYMELFVGYINEQQTEVYSTHNLCVNYNNSLVKNFDHIDYFVEGLVRCSTFNQVVNDMLDEYDTMDASALAEALSEYHEINGSFDNITVEPRNLIRFQEMQDWALEFHCGA